MSRRQIPTTSRFRSPRWPAAAGHRPLLLAVALAAGFAGAVAHAQPTGAQAIHGTAALSQQGSKLVVTTQNGAGTSHSAINWQSFSVPGGTTTHFDQPGVTSTSINRVLGPDPSAIFGTLSSNGRLVLVNPAGIAVGAGAVVDTAGFTASTLRMSDADALAGRLRFGDGGGAAGALRVDGQVLARSGDVVLIGTDVQAGTQALIQSPEGATVLAAGQKVEVTGRGLEGIVFQVQAPSDQAVNLGTLRGDAVGVFAGTLRHSGLVQAEAVSTEGGKVVLKAADHAEAAGTTQARGLGGAGGYVDVLGRTVGVMAGAVIDTSNTNGGGQIRVGGDYKGVNPDVPNAQVTWVASDAQLRANATDRGDGGKVIVWADDSARAYGRIEAKGGANGGDGGFVETSGKRYLDVNGVRVDASAAAGQAGTWLLDPSDIFIVAGSGDGQNLGVTPSFYSADGGSSTLSVGTLNSAINGNTSVTVSTGSSGTGNGDIVFDASNGDIRIAKNSSGVTDLRLQADGQIRFTGAQYQTHFVVDDANDAGVLNVHLQANGSGQQVTTYSGAAVQFSTLGFAGNGNRLNVILPAGKIWQNEGSVLLNLNSMLRMDGAVFNNLGVVDGAGGPYGGVGGYGSLGAFNNAGTVYLTEGQFRVAELTNTNYMEFVGNTNVAVTHAFSSPGSFYFAANDLSITQQAADLVLGNAAIDAASVALFALNGSVIFDYIGTSIGESGGLAGGPVTIQARDQVTGYGINAAGGWGANGPGAGGNVSITAGGDITIQGYISAWGGDGSSDLDGARGGNVSLVSGAGSVNVLGGIDAQGGWTSKASGSGGAGGSVQIRAFNGVEALYVDVGGGDGGVVGGRGGFVDIEAGHSLLPGDVYAGGGWGGYDTGGAGGAGGSVRLVQRSGDLVLSNTYVDVGGGWGGDSATVGGVGGQGGRIKIEALGGGVLLDAYQPMESGSYSEGRERGSLHAAGGEGGYIYGDGGTTGVRGGQGGHGGSIEIRAAGASRLQGKIDATGGFGGYVDGSSAVGGNGGNGGAIQLAIGSTLQLAGDVHASSGAGGLAYSYESYGTDVARVGAAGAIGTVRTAAAGGIVVPSTAQVAEPSFLDESLQLASVTPGTIVPGELRMDAQWTNASQLSIQSGATVMTTGTLVNEGGIDLAGGARLDLGHYDPYGETFNSGGVTLFNAATGTVQGSGTINGNLVNAGAVAPGGSGTIGALTVTGNYTQQPTGVLQMDIAANTPYLPGMTYDQLVVYGGATLGGQLQVAAIPAVATPTSSQLVAGATQLVAIAPSPTTYYELLSASSASGQFSLISGPPALVSQIRMNVGGTAIDVPGVTAAGLAAAIASVLPGVTLDQIQQAITESINNSIANVDSAPGNEDEAGGDPQDADIVVTGEACKPA